MDIQKHQNEIAATRVGGFGGSDAKLFVRLAEVGDPSKLAATYQKRIAVALGLTPYISVPATEAMQKGHDFEELFAIQHPELQREVYLERNLAKNFKTFAHADFVDDYYGQRIIYELKYSDVYSTLELMRLHEAQLQWYYLLGADCVVLETKKSSQRIDNEFYLREKIETGIEILDAALSDGWQPVVSEDYAPDEITIANLQTLKGLKMQAALLDERIKALTAEIGEIMTANMVQNMTADGITVTMVAPTTRQSVDAKKLQQLHPDVYAEVLKTSEVKGSIKVTLKQS